MDNTGNGEQFPVMEEVFKESRRVLRRGGIMVIAGCLPFTQKHSIWFNHLHLGVTERWCKLFPTIKQYEAMFDKCGFKIVSKMNCLGLDLLKHYTDPEFAVKPEWRSGSSYFGFATESELLEIEEKAKTMVDNGTMVGFIKEHNKVSEIGALNILMCRAL